MGWTVSRPLSSAAVLALAGVLSACGGQSTLKADGAAKAVADLVVRETGFRATDVRCPSGVPAKVGGTFQCHFTGPDGLYTAYMRILRVKGERVDFHIATRRTG